MTSSSYELIFQKGDLSACKCLIVSEFAGVDVKQNMNLEGAAVRKAVEVVSPLGRLPVLTTPSGGIWGSEAVGRYLSSIRRDLSLYGNTAFESSQVDAWLAFCSNDLYAPLACLVFEPKGAAAPRSLKDAKLCLCALNKHLLNHTFLAAEGITMADIWIVVSILEAKMKCGTIDEYITKDCPNLWRWLDTCCNQRQMKKQLAAFGLSNESKPAVAGRVEGESDEEAPAKKVPNVLDSLPPSSMSLDEWKRCYSNTKDLYGEAMNWFWTHFDKDGWSLWYMKYDKVEGECQKGFLTSNLLGGFLQRLEQNFRKYSFAVLDVVEENEESFDIQGVWLLRGQELPKEITEHLQFESHTFTKLDTCKAEHKKLIADYWCADEMVEGRKITSSNVWK